MSTFASDLASVFTAVSPAGCGTGAGDISSTAGAADPMMTTLMLVVVPGKGAGCVPRTLLPAKAAASPDASALGLPLRAESAANGDTELERATVGVSARRASTGRE